MGKSIVLLVLVSLIAGCVTADDKATYESLLEEKRYPELLKHLRRWETKDPQNPELYAAYCNYYIAIGMTDGVSIDSQPKAGSSALKITDPKTGEVLGYINSATNYDPDCVSQAIIKLNEGLSYGPDRLDLYFGKIHILNKVYDFQTAGDTVIQVLNRSKVNENRWLWANNQAVDDGEAYLLNSLQAYYNQWFKLNSLEGFELARRVASEQIKLYPDNLYAYNNLGYTYIVFGELEPALKYYHEAEGLCPEDAIILLNIAATYIRLGDKKTARDYYTKVIDYGNEDQKRLAKEKLDSLL